MSLQTKSSSIKLPEVHSVNKTPQIKKNIEIKPRLGQGRAGSKM